MSKQTTTTGITVGQLARAAAVNVETVRYYQRIGLLRMPRRDYGSIRRYLSDDLKRIRFIKRAQNLGFSLDEIALLLGLSDGKHCAETKVLAQTRLVVVEEKIADLAAIQKALKSLVAKCSKGTGDAAVRSSMPLSRTSRNRLPFELPYLFGTVPSHRKCAVARAVRLRHKTPEHKVLDSGVNSRV